MKLEARGLSLEAGGRQLLEKLDLALAPGMKLAILGANGSGKTTLMHALAGLRKPESGEVSLDGRPSEHTPSRAWARAVGLLPQLDEAGFFGTVRDYVALGRFPHGGISSPSEDREVVEGMLADMELEALAKRPLATLSGGERQRARLAQLLAQTPRICLLDEPLTHLDLRHQARLFDVLDRLVPGGASMAMSLHEPAWAKACSHVLMLDGQGRWTLGKAAELLTKERLERLYGCRFDSSPSLISASARSI
jgi:ABC-type cobalamin/Fe3+-siderophores transport system ATPase subunit